MTAPVKRRLVGPPGFNLTPYLARLSSPSFNASAAYRRQQCHSSPILFALYYLAERHLALPARGGVVLHALSDLHIEMAMAAKQWMRSDLAAKECRHAWVAPRFAAKTTWSFLILPLWAMAFGHRKYLAVWSDIEGQAKLHLKTLRADLRDNERLMRDFPQLCAPAKDSGRAIWDNAEGFLAASGALIQVKGMNSAALGAKFRERRPDALLLDEIEPKEGSYSIEQKDKRLIDLIDAIFPCNDAAAVTITGTTVMHGSIIHDLIEGKDWADAERIKVHHFPGIIEDPVTGEERSLWPAKWTLEYLRNERKESPRSYAKNFENRPVAPGGTFWDDNDITYTDKYLKWTTERILILDPAAKSKKTNDETGIALLSYSQNARKTTVERVTGVREKPTQLRELVHRVAMKNGIRLILVDVTNGGDHVLNTLMPLPRGVKILPVHIAKRSKDDRFSDLHDLYQRGAVVHAKLIPELEAQMKAYPRTLHDDRIDAVAIGVEYFVKGFPGAAAVAS